MRLHRIILLTSCLMGVTLLLNAQNPLPKRQPIRGTALPDELPNGRACTITNEYGIRLRVQKEGEGIKSQEILLPANPKRTTIRLNDCGKGNCDGCYCNYTLKIATQGKAGYNAITLKPATRYIVRYSDKTGWYIEEYAR